MAYNKTTWETGDTITAELLNNMEDGIEANDQNIGALASLNTSEKGSLVGAVNEVDAHADSANANVGTLSNLTTSEKGSLVGAVNEVDSAVAEISENIGIIEGTQGGAITPSSTENQKAITGGIGETITITTPSQYNYAVYSVSPLTAYFVTTRIGKNENYPYYAYFTNNSDVIIDRQIPYRPDISSSVVATTLVNSPVGATKLYVVYNASNGYAGTVNEVVTTPLQDQITHLRNGVCYVNGSVETSGNGTDASPYKTIQEGINDGAETVVVTAGTYAPFSVSGRTHPLRVTLPDMPTYGESVPDLPKITIESNGNTGIVIQSCTDVYLSDIHVRDIVGHSFNLKLIENLECVRCIASGNTTENESETYCGFYLRNINGVFRDCLAYDCDLDGFNIHGYGNTQFINCSAHDCRDDGISHHDACTGIIIGGEYYNCDKGGISTPTSGAAITVMGAYSHDNIKAGLHVSGASKAYVSNCIMEHNGTYDINIKTGAEVIGWNNVFSTSYVDGDSSFVEHGDIVRLTDQIYPRNVWSGEYVQGYRINWSTGARFAASGGAYVDYYDISAYDKIIYSRLWSDASSATYGMAFYDANKVYISGENVLLNADNYTWKDSVIDVPEGAVYARFTWGSELVSVDFHIYDYTQYSNSIMARLEALEV